MPERTVRIAFRGLMVLNYQTDAATNNRYMEIGFLDARTGSAQSDSHVHTPASSAVHIPRVLTTQNGVLSDLLDLRTKRELGTVRRWDLIAPTTASQTPAQTEVKLKGTLPADRSQETDVNKEDFGWIIDLENREMHNGNLTSQISTARLLMVLTVRQGEFSTRLLSPTLIQEEIGVGFRTPPFGKAAAVTGLDIKFNVPGDLDEARVQLFARSTLIKELVTKTDPITKQEINVHEISNAPPDVPADGPASAGGHFHMYYDKLFIQSPPSTQFDFRTPGGGAPAPDPALCGVTFLGLREDAL